MGIQMGGGGGVDAAARARLDDAEASLQAVESSGIHLLAAAPAAGGTTITLDRAPALGAKVGWIAIDVGTSECEIRQVTNVVGAVVTVAALTFAHATSDRVLYFQGDLVPVSWFGVPQDGSTDAEPTLQAALAAVNTAGMLQLFNLSLTGEGRTYRLAKPLMLPNHTGMKQISLSAHASYGPDDSKGAMVMPHRGTVQAFTATAAGDLFTTPAVHGMSTASQVVFKGLGLPTGVTAGKVYYVKTVPTTTTFTVSATSGGATLDLTADGGGTCYPDPQALTRLYLDGVFINGGLIGTVINGLRANLQQPAAVKGLRVDNCTGIGYVLAGQQAYHENVELISNGVGLALDGAAFMDFDSFDAEQNGTQFKVLSAAQSVFSNGGGGFRCDFSSVHMEASGAEIGIDLAGQHTEINMDGVHWTQPGSGAMVWQHGGDLTQSGYRLRDIRAIVSAGANTIVQDDNRGRTLANVPVGTLHLAEVGADPCPSDGTYSDEYRHELIGRAGGYIRWGATHLGTPNLAMRPDTGQTADQVVWRNGSGADKSGINKDGTIFTKVTAAPADGDLVAGQGAWWLDQTAGVPQVNFKGKDSGGTVFTRTLPQTVIDGNAQTASYTLVAADAGKCVEMNHATNALVLTVPPNSSVAFPVGTVIEVARMGGGTVTVAAGAGVTIRSKGSLLAIANQYGAASLRKRATDEWVLVGDLA